MNFLSPNLANNLQANNKDIETKTGKVFID